MPTHSVFELFGFAPLLMVHVACRDRGHCGWSPVALWSAAGLLGCLLSISWGSWQRHTGGGFVATSVGGGRPFGLSVAKWPAGDCGGSHPSGNGFQSLPPSCVLDGGWRACGLDRSRPMGFDYIGDIIYGWVTWWGGGWPHSHRLSGEEDEAEPSGRPRGRIRVHCGSGGKQREILRLLPAEGGRLACRRRGPLHRTDKCGAEENGSPQATTLRGLQCLCAVCKAVPEGTEVPVLHPSGGRELPGQDGPRTCLLRPLAGLLQGVAHHLGDDGHHQLGQPDGMGILGGEAQQEIPRLLGPGGCSGGPSQGGIYGEDPGPVEAGHRQGRKGPSRMGSTETLGYRLEQGSQGRGVLERERGGARNHVGSQGFKGQTLEPHRGSRGSWPQRGLQVPEAGNEQKGEGGKRQSKFQDENKEGGQKEKEKRRQGRAFSPTERKRWRKGGWATLRRKRWLHWRGLVLRLEQRERPMRRTGTRRTVQRKGPEGPQVHRVPVTRAPIEGLPTQEISWEGWWAFLTMCGGSHGGGKGSSRKKQEPEGTVKGKELVKDLRNRTKRRKFCGDDPEGEEDPPEGKIRVKGDNLTFEEYLQVREFFFLHHFSGKEDKLSKAIKEEAEKRNVKVKTLSVDRANGDDLRKDHPFKDHLDDAAHGRVDGYHSGFPCTTFSRLRWRPAKNMPGPVRSKLRPYGLAGLPAHWQKEADDGTVMMTRSCMMVGEQYKVDRMIAVGGFSTLENPPPSDHPEHISAWHMPEMVDLIDSIPEFKCAYYNMCAFEEDLAVGEKHFKPGLIGGTLPGIEKLARKCGCGNATHEPITGKERSELSAAYPEAFCKAYAELAVDHFLKVAQSEFLEGRMVWMASRIEWLKAKTAEFNQEAVDIDAESNKILQSREYREGAERLRTAASIELLRKRKAEGGETEAPVTKRPKEEEEVKRAVDETLMNTGSAKEKGASPSKGVKSPGRGVSPPKVKAPQDLEEKKADSEKPKAETPVTSGTPKEGASLDWVGGRGKYGLLREPKAKTEIPAALVYVGGMRDPHKAVAKLPTLQVLGGKIWKLWNSFLDSHPDALEVAETYGTPACAFDPKMVAQWKAWLKKELHVEDKGPRTPPTRYQTPVDVDLLRAWATTGGDWEKQVPTWLEEGTPLGIEKEIECSGVFPPQDSSSADPSAFALSDAVLERPDTLKNYKSVEEDLEGAEAELVRYEKAHYLRRVSLEEAQRDFPNGTTSRLGLVTKVKEGGEIKRRIVIDLRRSGGNQKSHLPERLVLPRALDAVKMMRDVRRKGDKAIEQVEPNVLELAVVDIKDAFTVLPVHPAEWKHTMAPSTRQGEILQFQALLFGFKVAPLLYSRFAAQVARLLQSAIQLGRGAHEVYLDDSLWALQGSLQERSITLAFILNTMAALGVNVSLGKGARASEVTWIGIKLTLVDQDTLVLGLPEKFISDMMAILQGWENAGYASLKELRVVAGKNAWLSGVLPRARWVTAVLYAVLTQTLKEEAEEEKAPTTEQDKVVSNRTKRQRKGLFAVKRLELARKWLLAFLEAAKTRPMRKVLLGRSPVADIRLTTDASPEGLGGIFSVNGRTLGAFFYRLEATDVEELLVDFGSSSSQAVVEVLAILFGIHHFKEKIRGATVALTVQADSITALAVTQKLGAKASSPGLNFLGAELALSLESLGVEEIRPLHIPGKANVEADFLSRPSTWDRELMPDSLDGVDIAPMPGPAAAFYRLPTPKAAPSLWGVQSEGAGVVSVWDAVI